METTRNTTDIYASFTSFSVTVKGRVARLVFDHPPMNIEDAVLMNELKSFVETVRTDTGISVIVFSSVDPDFFIAHGDAHFVTKPETFAAIAKDVAPDTNPMQALHESVRQLPQVTIGKLNGIARGGGSELLMAMDMRFAARDKAVIAQPESMLGILPGGGGTQYITRLAGRPRALEVILGGDRIDAATAELYGLINKTIPDDRLDGYVDDLAAKIGLLDPAVIRAIKQAVDAAIALPIADGLKIENERLNELFSPSATALTYALLEKGYQTREAEIKLEELLRDVVANGEGNHESEE